MINIDETMRFFIMSQFSNTSSPSFLIVLLVVGHYLMSQDFHLILNNIKHYLTKRNAIVFEGTKSICHSYNDMPTITANYCDEFMALFEYIMENSLENNSINELKYIYSNINKRKCSYHTSFDNNGIYIVDQGHSFNVCKNIQAYVDLDDSKDDDDKKSNQSKSNKTTTIRITLFSYVKSVIELKNFVKNICDDYKKRVEDKRKDKKYLYSLTTCKFEEDVYDCWNENIFKSTCRFNNLFFDEKQCVQNKVDFFLNNEKWYYDKGIPYSLGIGLYGTPGTGKTSFIKALANYTNRHIVTLSFKIMKTVKDLDTFFYENVYNGDNKDHPIDFDSKIIVFEDIDCASEIVFSRDEKKKDNFIYSSSSDDDENDKRKKYIKTNGLSDDSVKVKEVLKPTYENPITLDDILNVFDGIKETPGRIIIITSNHYDKLDKALVRPGRIDITMEMKNASKNVLKEMFFHFFNKKISSTILNKYIEHSVSPAEITSFYLQCNNNIETFNKLLLLKSNL